MHHSPSLTGGSPQATLPLGGGGLGGGLGGSGGFTRLFEDVQIDFKEHHTYEQQEAEAAQLEEPPPPQQNGGRPPDEQPVPAAA